MNTSLNAARRARELAELADGAVVDVLVIGGGVTGTGIALDAASRGLSVALVEAHDLAFGTSRWSSKLVHGGLRYLAKGDVRLAHESAVERGILMTRTAPHLTRPLPQLFPLHEQISRAGAAFVGTGLRAGDALRRAARTPSSLLPRPRRVSGQEALALAPGLRSRGLRGGLLSFDGQLVDDARLVVALARTAAGLGARILTRVKVTEASGQEASAVDTCTGSALTLRARAVVNAAGVWAGDLVDSVRLRPSLGSHVVVDGQVLGLGGTALTVPVPGERNRFVIVLPQRNGLVYIGLTDELFDGPIPDEPTAPAADVEFLLRVASSVLERPLGPGNVLGSYAGLRPLLDAPGRSADLSRHHAVLTSPSGVVTVVGGKLTTYRQMAQDAVDAAVRGSGVSAGPSLTRRLPLVGADSRERLGSGRLAGLYGTEAPVVAALSDEVVAGEITAGEILFAVRHEGALSVDDVVHRRTRIGLVASWLSSYRAAVSSVVEAALPTLT
ncbi:glycerol-3-phosphate dehydrogenase [Actinophytocola xinjiangensis]|uniref:Glycerol-3-phosphate dehydrogenase n=1 Tax=Actinophytocola xinjiangensis TaxID=485602 RepID=A0A7Z0WK68_9PSEU|nr:glycerol-3-phosphate dehydrogenase/oxidase [Actinophytocola xinjiangensis]OLF09294.1 glycerol-3-phosphate dehydrogenase [Actinophytocola xinjiangensis]